MPKKLSENDQQPDPVRSRLREMASKAAAPPGVKRRSKKREQPNNGSPKKSDPQPPANRSGVRAPQLRQHRGSDTELTHVRKARFTQNEADANAEMLAVIARMTGSKMSQASVTRVLWYLLRCAEDSMKGKSSKAPKLKRPPNGFGFETAEYEQRLAEFVLLAIKDVAM